MTNGVACHSDGEGEDNSICQILHMRMRMRTVGMMMRVILRMRMRKMMMMVIVHNDGDVEEVWDDDDNGDDVC